MFHQFHPDKLSEIARVFSFPLQKEKKMSLY